MEKPFLVGLAGGSGSGKSTLAYALQDRHPDKVGIFRFDDYQAEDEKNAPLFRGFRNWDHPSCVDFEAFIKDLKALKEGKPVSVRTWGSRDNPEYAATGKRIEITVRPKEIIVVEGYLLFYSPEARDLLDLKIYLEAPEDVRLSRRGKLRGKEGYEGYERQVLAPMHNKYLSPTKEYADYIFDTARLDERELVAKVEKLIPPIWK